MANLETRPYWSETVRQIEPGDKVIGGTNAPINLCLGDLADRTEWLKKELSVAIANIGKNNQAAQENFASITAELARKVKNHGALSSRNLNDLKGDANYGVWHQTANAAATPERNYPTTEAGTLYVLPSAYQGQQIYYPLDQNVFYKRHSLPDGSWSAWHTMCEVIDSPSSTSTTGAASANQVKRLNDRAANIERTKLGNTGNQTISNGGLIVGNPTVWFKTTYPSGNGRWVFETDPAGSVNTPNSIRFNYKFEEDGQPVKYLSFPDIGTGQIVAYQSWVNNRIKFARPSVKSGSVAVNLDLTQRAQIIAELGNDFIANGVNQLVIHNTGTQHNVTNLPLPNKSPVQLDIVLMGDYSYIDCHYVLLHRSFRTSINWNNEILTLNWKENLTQDNGVMLSGNQTIAGEKTFSNVSNFSSGVRVSHSSKNVWATLHMGISDVYLHNPISNKYLQLKDDGTLAYSNDKILLYSDRSNAVNLDSDAKIATSKAVKITYDKAVDAENSAAQSAPSGMIAYFARNAAPAGWLKANGAAVSRTTYAALFSAIGTTFGAGDGSTTFNLPDLRSEFLRGWDDGRGVDTGRAFGARQGDAIRNIVGQFVSDDFNSSARLSADNTGVFRSEIRQGEPYDAHSDITGDAGGKHAITFDASRSVPTANENRPRNIALLACIKI